jgi:carbonic anhydrase
VHVPSSVFQPHTAWQFHQHVLQKEKNAGESLCQRNKSKYENPQQCHGHHPGEKTAKGKNEMDIAGIEPATSCMLSMRATNCAKRPFSGDMYGSSMAIQTKLESELWISRLDVAIIIPRTSTIYRYLYDTNKTCYSLLAWTFS